jgi:hypothetical protein
MSARDHQDDCENAGRWSMKTTNDAEAEDVQEWRVTKTPGSLDRNDSDREAWYDALNDSNIMPDSFLYNQGSDFEHVAGHTRLADLSNVDTTADACQITLASLPDLSDWPEEWMPEMTNDYPFEIDTTPRLTSREDTTQGINTSTSPGGLADIAPQSGMDQLQELCEPALSQHLERDLMAKDTGRIAAVQALDPPLFSSMLGNAVVNQENHSIATEPLQSIHDHSSRVASNSSDSLIQVSSGGSPWSNLEKPIASSSGPSLQSVSSNSGTLSRQDSQPDENVIPPLALTSLSRPKKRRYDEEERAKVHAVREASACIRCQIYREGVS